MSSLNRCEFIGRLGADPEMRFTPSGAGVCNFDIACDSVWKDRDGQKQKRTEWVKIVVWGAQAEACSKYLNKGRQVFVAGELRTRSYDDKQGVKRYVTEIHAREVLFLTEAQAKPQQGAQGSLPTDDGGLPPLTDDDVPF